MYTVKQLNKTKKTYMLPLCRLERTRQLLLYVLRDINAQIEQGRMYAILGPSRCGKTTLLSLPGGLDSPCSGQILYQGEDIAKNHFPSPNFTLQHPGFSRVGMALCISGRFYCKLACFHFVKVFPLPYRIIEIIPFNKGNEILRINNSQIIYKTCKPLIQNIHCISH